MPKHKPIKNKQRNKKQVQNKWYRNKTGIVLITLVCLAGVTLTLYLTGVLNMGQPTPKSYNSPIPMVIDVNKKYTATIKTVKGDIVCELYPQDAPVTVNSFVSLARKGYYNGCTFHRVIPGFMAQGGDPTGTGSGGPGYQFQNEISSRKHVTGALSMAHSSLPNSNGSQFFICYQPQPALDGKYTVFGQVIQGMDVVNKLTPRDPTQSPTFTGDVINEIDIAESN
jgi:cyclophilin family peptidyl-prolyl cis-trans isomerase